MARPITLADVTRPPGDPRGWLAQRARAAPGAQAPVAAVVLGHGGLTRAVRDGVPLESLAAVEAALVARLRPDWVGCVGSALLSRDGRPVVVRFARLRRDDGTAWVATWIPVPGKARLSAVPDDVYDGEVGRLPGWLAPLVPAWPPVEDDAVQGTAPVVDGPQTLEWRRDPIVAAPDVTVPVPDGAAFRDVVEIAGGLLAAGFEASHVARPTVVVWSDSELCAWAGDGARGAREAHALGRRLARDAGVVAVGLFGRGQDQVDGEVRQMVALAMEHRELGSVVWVRHFAPSADGPRWLDAEGAVKVPGPRMGWFER